MSKSHTKLLCVFYLIGLISLPFSNAKTIETPLKQIPIVNKNLTENTIIAYYDLYNNIVSDKKDSVLYRKLLKINGNGSYLVQDFHSKTDKQFTTPMTIKKADDLLVDVLRLENLDGTIVYFNEDGSRFLEKTFKNGKVEGTVINWNKTGQKIYEAHYKNNNLEGKIYSWHANGQKKSEGDFKNGKPDGKLIDWNDSGVKKSELHYKAGKQDGITTHWYANKNQKLYETHYKNGKREGLHTTWYENGQKHTQTHYKNDMQDGLDITWNENGQKESEITYKEDKPLDHTQRSEGVGH